MGIIQYNSKVWQGDNLKIHSVGVREGKLNTSIEVDGIVVHTIKSSKTGLKLSGTGIIWELKCGFLVGSGIYRTVYAKNGISVLGQITSILEAKNIGTYEEIKDNTLGDLNRYITYKLDTLKKVKQADKNRAKQLSLDLNSIFGGAPLGYQTPKMHKNKVLNIQITGRFKSVETGLSVEFTGEVEMVQCIGAKITGTVHEAKAGNCIHTSLITDRTDISKSRMRQEKLDLRGFNI